jgi:hypothetical protein
MYGDLMEKTRLLDLFGLSGDPSDNARLDDLFFRLESDASFAPDGISILIGEGGSNCNNEFLSTGVCTGGRPDRSNPVKRSTRRHFHIHGITEATDAAALRIIPSGADAHARHRPGAKKFVPG